MSSLEHIGMLSEKFNIQPLRDELRSHPEIWDTIPYRVAFAGSPHREVQDIWVRYNDLRNWDGGAHFNDAHRSVWYPVVDKIPSARLLSISLLSRLDGEQLGGVLITRVPAHKQVYPHVDSGWHARFYEKFIIQIASAPGQSFCFEDGRLGAEPGECYWFDNAFKHWVVNPTDQERISLIICLRRSKCH
jgi:hypothetical protein